MSAVAAERNGAVVVVGRRDWRDLPAQADFGQAMFGMAGSGYVSVDATMTGLRSMFDSGPQTVPVRNRVPLIFP